MIYLLMVEWMGIIHHLLSTKKVIMLKNI